MAKSLSLDPRTSFVAVNTGTAKRRIDEVLGRHDVLRRAAEAGQKNEPYTTDQEFDETQRLLIGESQGFIGTLMRVAKTDITDRENSIRMLMPRVLVTNLERSKIKLEVSAITKDFLERLTKASQWCLRTLQQRRSFEEEHGQAPASGIYGDDLAVFFSVLIALVLAEGVFNAFLLQELQDRGLLGGLMLAVGVGMANVLIGLGMGFFGWRLMIHVNRYRRLAGIVITAICASAGLALHLALGELREAITHNAAAQVDFLIITQPWRWFRYTSIPPFVLFAVGVATFLIAALKGRGGNWGVVTPYWGYDIVDRRFRAADAALEDATEDFKDAVYNAYGSERAKLRARHAEDGEKLREIRRIAAEAQGIVRTLGDSIEAEIGNLHVWLRMYRDRNRAVRMTPAPAYFAVYPEFEEWRAARLDVSDLLALAGEAERIWAENGEKLVAVEQETLEEQIAVVEEMMKTISDAEVESARRIAKDDAIGTPKAA